MFQGERKTFFFFMQPCSCAPPYFRSSKILQTSASEPSKKKPTFWYVDDPRWHIAVLPDCPAMKAVFVTYDKNVRTPAVVERHFLYTSLVLMMNQCCIEDLRSCCLNGTNSLLSKADLVCFFLVHWCLLVIWEICLTCKFQCAATLFIILCCTLINYLQFTISTFQKVFHYLYSCSCIPLACVFWDTFSSFCKSISKVSHYIKDKCISASIS